MPVAPRRVRPHLRRAPLGVLLATLGAAPLGAQAGAQAGGPPRADAPRPAPPAEPPAWAMPLGPLAAPPFDSVLLRRVPGSALAFTDQRTHNRFDAVDWHPASHPAMPPVVARGRAPAVWACGLCHLPDGGGRPENAQLAGLPAAYIVQQVAAMRAGEYASPWPAREQPINRMLTIADSATASEVHEAARYFARLRPHRRARVVEATRIPRVRAAYGLYFLAPGGGDEPLGQRLIEVPTDAERHELRDARVGYVAYVPPGSVARGRVLATRGGGRDARDGGAATRCTGCHGPQLRGVGLVPPIAGRSPSFLLRQLIGFAAGTRSSPPAAPMRAVAASLSLDDMIAAAAYAGSLTP